VKTAYVLRHYAHLTSPVQRARYAQMDAVQLAKETINVKKASCAKKVNVWPDAAINRDVKPVDIAIPKPIPVWIVSNTKIVKTVRSAEIISVPIAMQIKIAIRAKNVSKEYVSQRDVASMKIAKMAKYAKITSV
jgi:hypothetical protein